MAHSPQVTCRVEYIEARDMWCVTVYVDGVWNMEQWFHTQNAAEFWAARKELG